MGLVWNLPHFLSWRGLGMNFPRTSPIYLSDSHMKQNLLIGKFLLG